jgi:hypothetical protein
MRIILSLLATAVVLLAISCGDGDNGSASGAVTPPAPATSPGPTPTRRPDVAPDRLCQMGQEPPAAYNVQVTARWEGKDRLVIEGSATLPGDGGVNYWACQDGHPTASLVWNKNPTFEDGKISAESKLVEAPAGPVFDPDAKFEVVLQVLGDVIQTPYFTVRVPVEGKPE